MYRVLLISFALIAAHCATAASADWDRYKLPVKLDSEQEWELQVELSDEFNYTAKAQRKTQRFHKRWKEGFINSWTGPGKTLWTNDHSYISDGVLSIKASRAPETDYVLGGCISSHEAVSYPVYVETYTKMNQLPLASCVWMLSDDSTEEIDILEAYGSVRPDQDWFAKRLHLSHHVFIRQPFQDYQPKSDETWYHDGTTWSEDFHRIGVYWRDPWHLEYYVDGELVRTASGKSIIDPLDYTQGQGLTKPMYLIINTENQDWRVAAGAVPTDKELSDNTMNTMQVDWIRVYKPVSTRKR